jgi:hypothetical protein
MYWMRNMAVNRLRLMSTGGKNPEVGEAVNAALDDHEPGAEPYGSMTREELADLLNLAYEAGDLVAYAVVEQHLMDKASIKELRIDNAVYDASMEIGKAFDGLGFTRMERVMTAVYDLVIDLDDERNAAEDEPQPDD